TWREYATVNGQGLEPVIEAAAAQAQRALHLHWRLNEPATDGGLKRLKQARKLATKLAGGDHSNIPIVHPIRWPGSWHRKAEPRLARIIEYRPEQEIDLGEALEALQAAATESDEKGASETGGEAEGKTKREDGRSTATLIDNIRTGHEFNPSIVPLAARLIGKGMRPG
ncbi:MAG: hypothetical protein K0S42_2686, partial [Microvirga sp.]|nr:hypothetical protein [Microvirga sp.]